MGNWEDKFVSRYNQDYIILCPFDYFKHKSYIYDFSQNN